MNAPASAIMALNAGSSSLKFALYPCLGRSTGAAQLSGTIEGLEPGGVATVLLRDGSGAILPAAMAQPQVTATADGDAPFTLALLTLNAALRKYAGAYQLSAVAHRIVHGGERYTNSVLIDQNVLEYLATLAPLAPLHQQHNLAGVLACRRAWPVLPQVGCFDTGFHASLPETEQCFALPRSVRLQGVRRYGFHGLSFRYLAARLAERSGRAGGRALLAHLGNGASACAMLGGQSIATSMGMSVLDGLMMGSRSGSVDPGVLLYLLQQGYSPARLETLLYRESGLLGVSGVSADMRTLRASGAPEAAQAIALFTHMLVKECGALAACLGGLDLIAFTGGIGEHDHVLRRATSEQLAFLGVRIDQALNRAADGRAIAAIHAADSTVEIWVVPTDEGRVAAGDAAALIARATD